MIRFVVAEDCLSRPIGAKGNTKYTLDIHSMINTVIYVARAKGPKIML